ncbi:hypothetical protein FKM82_002846 [Ascaphus truei]
MNNLNTTQVYAKYRIKTQKSVHKISIRANRRTAGQVMNPCRTGGWGSSSKRKRVVGAKNKGGNVWGQSQSSAPVPEVLNKHTTSLKINPQERTPK